MGFHTGQRVQLQEDWGFGFNKNDILVIEYSYKQKYGWMCDGEEATNVYTCKKGKRRAAWFHESTLKEISA